MTVPYEPVLVEIAVGMGGERCIWQLETMVDVSPHEFVGQVQGFIESLIWPPASVEAEDTPPEIAPVPSGAAGEVVSGEGAAAGSRAAAPEPRPRRRPAVKMSRSQARVAERLKQRGVDAA